MNQNDRVSGEAKPHGKIEERRANVWIHVPAAIWGAAIEFGGWVCPLTPLENFLRTAAGQAGYAGGFIEHYIVRILYPPGLTSALQIALGTLVVAANAVVYGIAFHRLRARKRHT